jgi:hypothetical protein
MDVWVVPQSSGSGLDKGFLMEVGPKHGAESCLPESVDLTEARNAARRLLLPHRSPGTDIVASVIVGIGVVDKVAHRKPVIRKRRQRRRPAKKSGNISRPRQQVLNRQDAKKGAVVCHSWILGPALDLDAVSAMLIPACDGKVSRQDVTELAGHFPG